MQVRSKVPEFHEAIDRAVNAQARSGTQALTALRVNSITPSLAADVEQSARQKDVAGTSFVSASLEISSMTSAEIASTHAAQISVYIPVS